MVIRNSYKNECSEFKLTHVESGSNDSHTIYYIAYNRKLSYYVTTGNKLKDALDITYPARKFPDFDLHFDDSGYLNTQKIYEKVQKLVMLV